MSPASQIALRNGQLPLQPTGFVGRQPEIATLGTLLSRSRLVTVTGPGGVGKTRLALHYAAKVASRYKHGVVFAELSGLRDPGLVPLSVASAVGLSQLDGREPLDLLIDHLRDRETLLILDTCEHLVDACAMLAEAIAREAPSVTLLATSRQPMDAPGESICPLAPLAVPEPGTAPADGDAVELFAQRAAAAVTDFRLTGDRVEQVIRLCRQLDGIPLAIELAAVRLRAFDLPELTRRLDRRLHVLSGGRRAVAPRHQALRDTIGWSYDLCTPDEQTLWNRLSVFAGPFTVSAAEEVCGGGSVSSALVLDLLIALVDKSVLVREDGPVPSYRMLDTIREYGAEQLGQAGPADQVRTRLLGYYRSLAEDLDADPLTGQLEKYRTLRAQRESVRAALRYGFGLPGQERAAARLAVSLYWYFLISGELSEGRYWLARTLEVAPDPSPERAAALLMDGLVLTAQGVPGAGIAECEEGLAIAEAVGADRVRARGYFYYCEALVAAGRLPEALDAGRTAKKLMAKSGDTGTAEALRLYMGLAHLLTGDLDACLSLCAEGLRQVPSENGERWLSSFLLVLSSLSLSIRGDHDRAAAALRQALAMRQELGDPMGMGYCLGVKAFLSLQQGRPTETAWLVGAASPVWKALGTEPFTGVPGLADLLSGAEATARADIGDDAWDATFARAAKYPLEEAAALAARDDRLARAVTEQGPPSGDGTRPPARLTAREREIAALIADGLSNRDIGASLFISKRTVDSHVEHILSKLRVRSRTDVARLIREQHEQSGTKDS